ncbi:MAG: ribonuclease D, partial [Raoultibacter sp.]
MYIANQEMLINFVERAHASSVLAIDTEFLREKTYYARLCLLQLATDTEVVVVDPFAVKDLGVLSPLLSDQHIVKLFHAGSQ